MLQSTPMNQLSRLIEKFAKSMSLPPVFLLVFTSPPLKDSNLYCCFLTTFSIAQSLRRLSRARVAMFSIKPEIADGLCAFQGPCRPEASHALVGGSAYQTTREISFILTVTLNTRHRSRRSLSNPPNHDFASILFTL